MKIQTLTLQHERVDDIPLLMGMMQRMQLPEILERHLGSHHLHKGISNGWLATGWLAFIMSQANHCKVSVQDWARSHQHTLQALIGSPLRDVEFSDDRLSIILRRFHDADWAALEANLWDATCQVYEMPLDCIRLDSTTSYGYHDITDDGVMQLGHSKDHRPDLPQLKLIAAAAQPTSQIVACDIVPGNCADDPLYLPLIRRLRTQLNRQGLLYSGDCKMAALETRADIANNQDYYLVPLPKTGETAQQFDIWIERGLTGQDVQLQELYKTTEDGKKVLFARGYEFERECTCQLNNKTVSWQERVQVLRSLSLAEQQAEQLDKKLRQAEAELYALTPAVGRGHRQIREAEELRVAVAEVLERYHVTGLLQVSWERQETIKQRQTGPGRPSAQRPTHTEVIVRYQLTGVTPVAAAIEQTKSRFGWRVQVTNLPKQRCGLLEAVLLYNGGWSLERDWHVLKDKPLGIQPLYVREEEQIIGLTRLLMIALRVLTLIELVVRAGLQQGQEQLSGLYEGQPKRKTDNPTAVRLLKAIVRLGITVTHVDSPEGAWWQLTTLPPLLRRTLELLQLPLDIYERLNNRSG